MKWRKFADNQTKNRQTDVSTTESTLILSGYSRELANKILFSTSGRGQRPDEHSVQYTVTYYAVPSSIMQHYTIVCCNIYKVPYIPLCITIQYHTALCNRAKYKLKRGVFSSNP